MGVKSVTRNSHIIQNCIGCIVAHRCEVGHLEQSHWSELHGLCCCLWTWNLIVLWAVVQSAWLPSAVQLTHSAVKRAVDHSTSTGSTCNIGRQLWVLSLMKKPLSILLGHHCHVRRAVMLCTDAKYNADQLCRYEDVLSPQDIYSLVGLTAFYNGFFGQCSQAFTRLESLNSLPEVSLDLVRLLSRSQ